MKLNLPYVLGIIMLLMTLLSCNKLIEVPESKSQVESSAVFTDSTLATSALLGAYYTLSNNVVSFKYISLYADEYAQTTGDQTLDEFSRSQVLPENYLNQSLWTGLYSTIYQANAVIEGVDKSLLSPGLKVQLQAESRFLRAFSYFYLLNLYDHIPMILSTNVDQNRSAKQTDGQTIYKQITEDLTLAKSLLKSSYSGSGKVRANRYAASALLARVYLYQKNWKAAEQEAAEILSSGQYSPLPSPSETFYAGNNEAILQWWNQTGFIPDASSLIPSAGTAIPSYVLLDDLYQSFTIDDNRKTAWIASNTIGSGAAAIKYPYNAKYKNRTVGAGRPEYSMVLRAAEQYLIRAEALARQGKIKDAIFYLNLVRSRANLGPIDENSDSELVLAAINMERRLELFGEYGHRFLDLKRQNQLDLVLGTLKDGWKSTARALPIPKTEITYNPNLIQNEGY